MKHYLLFKTLVLTVVLMLVLGIGAMANVGVTAPTGGNNLSADKAANSTNPLGGSYTAIGSIIITATTITDFTKNSAGQTIILTAPANWQFLAGTGTVSWAGNSATGTPTISVTASTITITFSTSNNNSVGSFGANPDVLTIAGIKAQATIGTAAVYLPATINPNTTNLNWSANVFNPATTDATFGSGNNFAGTSLARIVNAIWVITPSNPATTATLTLNWTSDLEGSYFVGYTNDNIGISHYNSTVHVWQNSTATGGADNSLNTVTSQFTSFSPFGVGSIGNPLPITIINFTAVLNSNNTVSLTCQTTVEENSDHFDVERSSDGSNWNSIGTVEAKGNSQIVVNYSYLDASPASGVNYYRLNLVDKNGSHNYTNVEVVTMNSIGAFRIFPNPAKDFVNLSLGRVPGNSIIRLINLGGQTVFTQQLNNESGNTVSIPVQNFGQGTYMVQVSGSDGSQHTGKVIIVR